MKMLTLLGLLALTLSVAFATAAPRDPERNELTNGLFDRDAHAWTLKGNARYENGEITLGSGDAMLLQRVDFPGLHVVYFGASLKPSDGKVDARVRIRCYDAKGRQLMNVDGAVDPKKGEAGVYLKTHALTTYLVASIEKRGKGTAVADSAILRDEDRDRTLHPVEVDLDAYMEPFWSANTVRDETVLLLSENGKPASGKLLFHPIRVLSVRDSTLHIAYEEGKDYRVEKDHLVVPSGSSIPSMSDSDFPKTEYPWLSISGKHVKVTYTHDDRWTGPIPAYAGGRLPLTISKLSHKRPVTVVALGDSITMGINVSSYLGEPPYMPSWAALCATRLRAIYGYEDIKMVNAGLGGMTASWCGLTAGDSVAFLKPDLVLIAFGMNDFWSRGLRSSSPV